MSSVNVRLLLVGLCLASACTDPDEDSPANGPDGGGVINTPVDGSTPVVPGNPAPGVDGSVAADGGTTPVTPVDGGVIVTPNDSGVVTPPGTFDYANQNVALMTDLVVPAGQTVRIGPGTAFTAMAAATKIEISGTVEISGTADAPVKFGGSDAKPRMWEGIVIKPGGNLKLSHCEISGAHFGVHALPGSTFAIDYCNFSESFKAAVLEADGTFDHSKVKAAPSLSFSLTNDVSLDDENGTVTIIGASPVITNSLFEGTPAVGKSSFVDVIRIGVGAKPTLDHLHVRSAHCGFHMNDPGSPNNSPKVTNSIIEDNTYGVMAYASKPIFENCVFKGNGNDLGFCMGATAANAAVLTNNFYAAGKVSVDSTCNDIGTKEPNPAKTMPTDVGPVGL